MHSRAIVASDRHSNDPVEGSWKTQVTDTVVTLSNSHGQTSDRSSNNPEEESWKTQVTDTVMTL